MQQLDLLETHTWSCMKYAERSKKIVEKRRISQFLMDLHVNFNHVRVRIPAVKPLTILKEVFSKVHKEESRKKALQGNTITSEFNPEEAGLAAQGNSSNTNAKMLIQIRKMVKDIVNTTKGWSHQRDMLETTWYASTSETKI